MRRAELVNSDKPIGRPQPGGKPPRDTKYGGVLYWDQREEAW
jgi:hypothetical protein